VCDPANTTIDLWMITPLNYSAISYWNLPLAPDYDSVPHTIYDYIRDFVGYRFQLQRASYDSPASIGKLFSYSFNLVNYGFSTIHNPRQVFAVILNAANNTIVAQSLITADPRRWQPYLPGDPSYAPLIHTITGSFIIPPSLQPGSYLFGIFLPDPHMKIPHSASFSVRFANSDTIWWTDPQGNYGINILGKVSLQAGLSGVHIPVV